jgi:hypothetical protein
LPGIVAQILKNFGTKAQLFRIGSSQVRYKHQKRLSHGGNHEHESAHDIQNQKLGKIERGIGQPLRHHVLVPRRYFVAMET